MRVWLFLLGLYLLLGLGAALGHGRLLVVGVGGLQHRHPGDGRRDGVAQHAQAW